MSLLLVMVITGFSLPWVRRNKFEWFYYMHHLFIPLLLFVCLHYSGALIYLIPGIAIYSVDKIMGLLAYKSTLEADTRMVSSDVVEITVKLAKGVRYHAGQYVFLNVPEISHREWHPFSVTSAPTNRDNDKIVFHLKTAGTWTRDVIAAQQQRLRVRLDGFYGDLSQLEHYKDGVMLVGDGIGVTPMVSLTMGLLRHSLQKVTLIWVVRTIDEFQIFSKELCQARVRYGSRLVVKVWITLSQPEPVPVEKEGHDTELASDGVDRDTMKELSPNDQFLRVVNFLQSTESQYTPSVTKSLKHNDSVDSSSDEADLFVPAGLSNAPAANSIVMALAIWMGVNSYAVGSWIVQKNEKISDPRENSTLLNLCLLCVFLLVTIALVVVVRHFVTKMHSSSPSETMVDYTVGMVDNTVGDKTDDKFSNNESTNSNSLSACSERDVANIEEPAEDKSAIPSEEDVLQSMIEGRIGCRPNLQEEFNEGTVHQADIGVVACGPYAMIQQINGICNSGSFTWGTKEGGAFFAFTEDEWEW